MSVDQSFGKEIHVDESDEFRILYVVTSGGKSYGGPRLASERFSNLVLPVLQEGVESLLTKPGWSVDVYLVLGFTLADQSEEMIRASLPPGVGLEVWSDAIPFGYYCKKWDSDPELDPIGKGAECMGTMPKKKALIQSNQALLPIQEGPSQLARQHRYVVKDKLPYYNFIMAWEDDMVVKRHHVEHHITWMERIRRGQRESQTSHSQQPSRNWDDQLSWHEWKTLRPGFMRVEILQDTHTRGTQRRLEVPTSKDVNIDAALCCHTNHSLQSNSRDFLSRPLNGSDLMLWESGTLGMGLRRLPGAENQTTESLDAPHTGWIALLPGVQARKRMHSFWPGSMVTPKPSKPATGDPKYISQSAGWMASPGELMEYHNEFCPGSFLPPFDSPTYQQDGFWRNNVEFWSGGIQLWCKCNVQRIISLESDHEFSKHLLYHSSNNKQAKIPKERLVQVSNFLGQLRTAQEYLDGSD